MDKWEYMVMDEFELFGVDGSHEWPTTILDTLGEEGWELVTTTPLGQSKKFQSSVNIYYFKRRVR